MSNTPTLNDLQSKIKDHGLLKTQDFVAYALPLLEQVRHMHEYNLVARISNFDDIEFVDNTLRINHHGRGLLKSDKPLYFKPKRHTALEVDEGFQKTFEEGQVFQEVSLTKVHLDDSPIKGPVFLPHYNVWEHRLGHFDPLSDIFVLGLVLATLAYQLNLGEKEDLERFVARQKQLYFFNTALHPTVHNVIFEMTQLYREDRLQNLEEAIVKLRNYREYNPENTVDLTETEGFRNQETDTRSQWILSKLKNRLFDISRRNKLLYFKEQQNFLNLTIASVPLLLDYQNIQEKDLIFWNDHIRNKILKSKKLVVNDYVDFNENKFLSPTVNKIRLDARRSQTEYGFSQLRLVVAFLHWYNFKEDAQEKITSPLLLLPTEIVKKKGVKDRYVLSFNSTEAEINPVLSNYLKDLYDIELPDFVDLEANSMQELVQSLQKQIAAGGSGVALEWRNKPKIKLIHSIAKRNFGLRNQRLLKRTAGLNVRNMQYSYADDEFYPLGLQIFNSRIRYKNNPLEYIINEDLSPTNNIVGEKQRTLYTADNQGEINPLVWEVDTCNITLGNFNYRKMSLVRDYNHIIDAEVSDDVFDQLFSEQPQLMYETFEEQRALKDNFPIITSDPTQTKAIVNARQGLSYIIQGPPGTGKSQTITNLIADFIARDKKILFVCEKRAALDVVFHRLKNRELDELCCLIHDSQADKKAFIQNLKATYESFVQNTMDLAQVDKRRTLIVQTIQTELEHLSHFHKAMKTGKVPPIELFEVLHANSKNHCFPKDTELYQLPAYHEWKTHRDWIAEWLQQLAMNQLGSCISEYAFNQLSEEVLNVPNLKKTLSEHLENLQLALDNFEEKSDDLDLPNADELTLDDWQLWIDTAEKANKLLSKNKLMALQPQSTEAEALSALKNELEHLQKEADNRERENKNWADKWSATDAEEALNQWTRLNGSFFKFLNPAFYKLKNQIRDAYRFSAHKIQPSIASVLEKLVHEYSTKQTLQDHMAQSAATFGLDDWAADLAWIEQNQSQPNKMVNRWITGGYEQEIRDLMTAKPVFENIRDEAITMFGNFGTKTIAQLINKTEQAQNSIASIQVFKPYIALSKQVSEELFNCLSEKPWAVTDFEFYTAYKSLKDIYDADVVFSGLENEVLQQHIRRINVLLSGYYDANVAHIRAKIRDQFNNIIRISESTAAQLTHDEKLQKKLYVPARRILENEFGKSMRYKSVRELVGGDAKSVLTALKPVWLMSPLSVSDTMPIDVDLFDVVIYDEASQITVEEGVPALFRTRQTIIVGDEMQMPPTNFFGSGRTADEDDKETEAQIGISLDADSLLNQGARKLSSVMLGWHYRSRHESLISFSNAAFYNRGLLTIPDNVIATAETENRVVTDLNEAFDLQREVLDKSISYHYLENATYHKRTNRDEADYIALMVQKLLDHPEKRSIGIVAFSMEQQSEIEEALTRLSTQDKAFETKLENEYQRMDEDQYNGLFVKNLENVQGDERDIIIMSVCYGYNASGRMLMNFGPINRRGGEKRLNVIFSRARKNMVVVSSIQPQDIKNDYNEGANYFKRFLSYAQHISDGNIHAANALLDQLSATDTHAQKTLKPIVLQIVKALNDLGYETETQVGQSHFKCDIAVKDESGKRYKLGILIDHGMHYQNDDVLEQYCQRPMILEAFGWKILRILNKDWLEQKERVLERIQNLLNTNSFEEDTETIPLVNFDEPELTEQESSVETNKIEAEEMVVKDNSITPDETEHYQRLEFSEGNSNKFWEITTSGTQLKVRYGRIGNKAQESIKTFDTEEKARLEMEKMLLKKLAKGYQRV